MTVFLHHHPGRDLHCRIWRLLHHFRHVLTRDGQVY